MRYFLIKQNDLEELARAIPISPKTCLPYSNSLATWGNMYVRFLTKSFYHKLHNKLEHIQFSQHVAPFSFVLRYHYCKLPSWLVLLSSIAIGMVPLKTFSRLRSWQSETQPTEKINSPKGYNLCFLLCKHIICSCECMSISKILTRCRGWILT